MEENTSPNTNIQQTSQPLKKKKVKWGRVSIVLAVLLLIILIVPFNSTNLGQKLLNSITGNVVGSDVVAIVVNEKITTKELDKEFNALSSQLQSYYTKELLLRELIDEKLILNEANKQKMTVTDQELDEILSAAEQNFPPGVALEDIAKNQGFTLQEYKDKIKTQILIKKFMDQNVIVKNVGEEEARTFFDGNKDKLATPVTVNASHILVAAKEEADSIETELKNGKKFEDLAREKSIDPGSKDKGGNLGFFPKGAMVKEFEDVALSLKIGEISDPVKSQFGYHIIRVESKKEASEANFDEIKDKIIQYLQTSENQQKLREFRDRLYNDALRSGKVKILYKDTTALNS
ncbi:MAG: peptidylprolyl isomerase [Nanoarchaeota archaeon]